jgi:transposase
MTSKKGIRGQVSATQGHLGATNSRSACCSKDSFIEGIEWQKKVAAVGLRLRIVSFVSKGHSLRKAARRFAVSLCTVQRWVARAGDRRLDRLEFSDRSGGCPIASNRSPEELEDQVVAIRKQLKTCSDLGEYGAAAIRQEMLRQSQSVVPSIRTIGRILKRRGALDGRLRIRRNPPPAGWYLPDLAGSKVELDSFDIVEGLVIRGHRGKRPVGVEVFNGISLHGGLTCSWPRGGITAKNVMDSLLEHWREFGLPAYAQFDNDRIFTGAHARPDTFGRVIRMCLSLGVTPVFAPPRETGFQAAIENYNGRWQAKAWARFEHDSLESVQDRSRRLVLAARLRSAIRIESAPPRQAIPKQWKVNLQKLTGKLICLRRTDAQGYVNLLGHRFHVSPSWTNRLVRSEVNLDAQQIQFYALRRREPTWQPLLSTHKYRPPTWHFTE